MMFHFFMSQVLGHKEMNDIRRAAMEMKKKSPTASSISLCIRPEFPNFSICIPSKRIGGVLSKDKKVCDSRPAGHFDP